MNLTKIIIVLLTILILPGCYSILYNGMIGKDKNDNLGSWGFSYSKFELEKKLDLIIKSDTSIYYDTIINYYYETNSEGYIVDSLPDDYYKKNGWRTIIFNKNSYYIIRYSGNEEFWNLNPDTIDLFIRKAYLEINDTIIYGGNKTNKKDINKAYNYFKTKIIDKLQN